MRSLIVILLLVSYVSAKAVDELLMPEEEFVDVSDDEAIADETNEDNSQTALQDPNDLAEADLAWRWLGYGRIAFSASLSSPMYLGQHQHLKFDHVMMNDGLRYDPSIGVFRPASSGVYLFAYTISYRGIGEVRVALMHNGMLVNAATANGVEQKHDVQSSNTAIIHVRKNEAVWIQSLSPGRLGDRRHHRLTTFSGHLLYNRK